MERPHETRDRDEDASHSTRTDELDSGGADKRVDCVASLHRRVGNQVVQRLAAEGHIQPNLSVSSPTDPAEREAKRVAEQVVEMPDPEQATADEENERSHRAEPLRDTPIGRSVTVTRQTTAKKSDDVGTELENRLESLKGGGRPLPTSVRSEFEQKMGHDFSDVRVHTGSAADTAARSIDARAFTHDSDVVFKRGEYAPDSPSGNQLLAHELTHVIQQGAAPHTDRVQRQEDGRQSESNIEGSSGSAGGGSDIPTIYQEAIVAAVNNMPEAEREAILDDIVPEERNDTAEKSAGVVADALRDELLGELAERVAGAAFGATVGAALGFLAIGMATVQALQAFADAQNPYEDIGGAMGGTYGIMCAIKRPETPDYPDPPGDITETARNAFIEASAEKKAETLGEMSSSSPEELVAYYQIYQADAARTQEILNEMWESFLGSVQYSNAKNLAPDTIEWPEPQSGLYDPGPIEETEEGWDAPFMF